MQLTITTDYAIRLVLYLALNKGRIVPATEIAEKMGIPKKYLIATAHKVKAERLIKGHMGVRGGYSLMRKPEEISVLDIVTVTQGAIEIDRYRGRGENDSAPYAAHCPVKNFFRDIQQMIENRFGSMTIAQLMNTNET